jgi:hypothetical protein
MVEFSDQFHGQDQNSVESVLRRMRDLDYRASVICLEAVGRFERHEWQTRLLAVGIDAVPPLRKGAHLFGIILFFRASDRDFLPSLFGWLTDQTKG